MESMKANLYFRILLLLLLVPFAAAAQREITLDEVRLIAKENNRELKISNNHASAAQYLRKASFTKFLPSFDFSSQYLRLNKPFNLLSGDLFLPVIPYTALDAQGNFNALQLLQSNPPALALDANGKPLIGPDGNFVFQNYAWIPQAATEFGQKNNLLMNVSLMQPIYTGGKIRAQYKAALHMEEMAVQGQRLSEAEVMVKAESLFWKLITLQEKKQLADQYSEMLQSLLNDVQSYVDEGIVSRNDQLRAQVAFNESLLEQLKVQNGITQVSMALNRMLGFPLTEKLLARETFWLSSESFMLEDLWQEGLMSRPEVKLVAGQAGLSSAMADMAKAAQYPNLAMGASYLAANPNPYNGFEKEFGHDWVVGLTLTMPIWHWGERRHLYKAALLEQNAMQLKMEDTHELIQLDITRAYFSLTEATRDAEIKKLSLEQASENLKIVKDGFDVGRVGTTDLLEAQTLWQQAFADQIESKATMREKYTELQKAIGK
jgi:outer membrane protein